MEMAEIRLEDFLQKKEVGKKLIFTDKVSVGNALMRQCNLKEGIYAWNIESCTPEQIARELIYAKKASTGDAAPEFITPGAAFWVMRNVLKAGKYSTFPETTWSEETIRDVLRCTGEMRENGVTDAFAQDAQNEVRLRELQKICEAFEKALEEQNLYDRAKCICVATQIWEKEEAPEQLLPWICGSRNGADVYCGYLETARFSLAEWNWIRKFAEKSDTEKAVRKITFLQKSDTIEERFYKAYGRANEVRRVGEMLVDKTARKAKIHFGDAAVYYSSPAYLNHIRAEFELRGIAYTIAEGVPGAETELMRFLLAVVRSAAEDFSYAELGKAFACHCMTFQNKLPENVWLNPLSAYQNGAGIGWGKQRYLEYSARIRKEENPDEGELAFADCLEEYIGIFDETAGLDEIAKRLWKFADVYTYRQNRERAALKQEILDMAEELRWCDCAGCTMQEKLRILEAGLRKITVSGSFSFAGKQEEDAVLIAPIGTVSVMERSHLFIVGLSAASMQVDDKQSPILNDEDKKKYLLGAGTEESNVLLASEKNAKRRDALEKSLQTILPKENIQTVVEYSYCDYDTVNLRDTAESIFFREHSTGHTVETVSDYTAWDGYVGDRDIRIAEEEIAQAVEVRGAQLLAERAEKREKYFDKLKKSQENAEPEEATKEESQEETNKEETTDNIDVSEEELMPEDVKKPKRKVIESASPSAIQMMLGCPLKYYYQYLRGLYLGEVAQPEAHQWLIPSKSGNLFHYFAEEYFQKAMPAEGVCSDAVNETIFAECYAHAVEKVLQELPYPSVAVFEREKEYYGKKTKDYIAYAHRMWKQDRDNGKCWKVLGCELAFGKNAGEDGIEVPIQGRKIKILRSADNSETEVGYEIKLNGSIDRVDAYLDGEGILHFRIVDYKTGNKEKKIKEVESGKQIQHILYSIAICRYLESATGKARIKELFAEELKALGLTEPTDYDFAWTGYVFPYENMGNHTTLEDRYDLETAIPLDDAKQPKIPDPVNVQLCMGIGFWQSGMMDEYAAGADDIIKLLIQRERESLQENDPKAVYGLKEFCNGNYCAYKEICRKWIGYEDTTAEEEDDE